MVRKVWFFLRDVQWTSVIAVALVVAGVVAVALGYDEYALPAGFAGATFALLSLRA